MITKHFAQQLEQRQDKRVVILGAGLIGCEFANDLQKQDTKSRWLILHHNLWVVYCQIMLANAFKQNLEETGIHFVLGTTVEKVPKIKNDDYYSDHYQWSSL